MPCIEVMELYINIACCAGYMERAWSTYSSDSSDTATTTTVITLYRCWIANIRIAIVYYMCKSGLWLRRVCLLNFSRYCATAIVVLKIVSANGDRMP